jgi:hypothetical protein
VAEKRGWHSPNPSGPLGAIVYAFLGALALWVVIEILTHVRLTWS